MTIEASTGRAVFPELDLTLGPTLTRSRFSRLPVAARCKVVLRHEPWLRYQLPVLPQGDTELYVGLQFHGERLVAMELFHSADRFGSSWEDSSQERELARKAFHEHWLSAHLGLACAGYRWGDITSNYDPRGGVSAILITYREPNAWQTLGRKAGHWWSTASRPR